MSLSVTVQPSQSHSGQMGIALRRTSSKPPLPRAVVVWDLGIAETGGGGFARTFELQSILNGTGSFSAGGPRPTDRDVMGTGGPPDPKGGRVCGM